MCDTSPAGIADPVFEHIARHREAAETLKTACDHLLDDESPGRAEDDPDAIQFVEQLAAAEFTALKQFEAATPLTLGGLFAKLVYAAETCRGDPETCGLYDIRTLLNSLADAALALGQMLPPA